MDKKFITQLSELSKYKKEELKFYGGIILKSLEMRPEVLTIQDIKQVTKLEVTSFSRQQNTIFYTCVINEEEKEFKMNIYELILKLAGVKL